MSDLTKIPDDHYTMGEFQQDEPPRMLSNRARDAFLALLDADHEPNEAPKRRPRNTREAGVSEKCIIFNPAAPNPRPTMDHARTKTPCAS